MAGTEQFSDDFSARWTVGEDALPGAPASGALPSGGQRHELAQPNDGPLERHARGVWTR